MATLTDTAANAALDAMGALFVQLHTADPTNTGTVAVSVAFPGRAAAGLGAAAARARSNTADITTPAGATVAGNRESRVALELGDRWDVFVAWAAHRGESRRARREVPYRGGRARRHAQLTKGRDHARTEPVHPQPPADHVERGRHDDPHRSTSNAPPTSAHQRLPRRHRPRDVLRDVHQLQVRSVGRDLQGVQSFGADGLWATVRPLVGQTVPFELLPDRDQPVSVDNPLMTGMALRSRRSRSSTPRSVKQARSTWSSPCKATRNGRPRPTRRRSRSRAPT